MSTGDPKTPIQVHCNACGHITEHTILFEENRDLSEDVGNGNTVDFYDRYKLIACAGCKAISMEHASGCSEDWDPETGISFEKEYFPPRTFRREPPWVAEDHMPPYIRKSLAEIYVALQNRVSTLAGLGIRALLEAIMVDRVGDRGSFAANLNALMEDGHVSRGQLTLLESTLEVGHAAMHRQFVISDEAIVACMDAVENVIQSIYVFPRVSVSLRKNVPRRRKSSKTRKRDAKS